jgi:hypothetical protein
VFAILRITRDSGYADAVRAYQVIVDGKSVGNLKAAETKQFAVSAGPHNLSLKIDWCGSNTIQFTVAEADDLTFHAKSNLRGSKLWNALWHVIFARDSYLLLEQGSSSQSKPKLSA